MAHLYRITPKDKKSIQYTYFISGQSENGDERKWIVTEYYNYGQTFRHLDDPVTEGEFEQEEVDGDLELGWGNELDDLAYVTIEFLTPFTDEEKEEIETFWNEGNGDGQWGLGWLIEGGSSWELVNENIAILGPFQIDLVDEDSQEVIEEDIGN